ncbi:glycosyltransferase family 2 protein [Flavobacterium anhuiense]|mgnify:CR=1 FL=1|uniref:glycosyltransferase family 2 protein n=1 Tax=Flavobacterium anhuiense TaxID=459526 RepID=UPI003D9520F3
MIIVYHQNNKIIEACFEERNILFSKKSIASNLFEIAEKYPKQLIIWCHLDLKSNLNIEKIEEIFHHKKIVASYNLSANSFLPEVVEYVDESLFLNIKKDVSYPTWMMSSDVGGIHAEVLNALSDQVIKDSNFDYFLCSITKLASVAGLLGYSEPLLIVNSYSSIKARERARERYFLAFRFVKQHYRTRWVFLLFLDLLLYEKKFAILPLFASFGFRKRSLDKDLLDDITVQSSRKVIENKTIDVIIPTIGRKKYLYDVLKDLSKQTHLPENVIIIEQNPEPDSVSELDYLNSESWPFTVKHTFTHQAGACNARNLALAEVTSEWVFLNDDDNRFESNLIEKTFDAIYQYGCLSVLTFYPVKGQKLIERKICQAPIFGSGNSFVKATALKKVKFNKSLEFGYGEDAEFGIQLRNIGFDVVYFPNLLINHLRAPSGGFRTKPTLAWHNDLIQPKPSPTIMFFKLNNSTFKQLMGYKTVLFFKFYKVQPIKNPIKYFLNFQLQWKSSLLWAERLKE